METRKVLSALSYFSILFAAFIFPLVVFFATEDSETKNHAKKAFLSHLIPLAPSPLLVISLYFDAAVSSGDVPVYSIIVGILMVIISIVVVIWNIVKGVKVLKD
jgi:protein-S-isoprenylcysteine O-methyltransferase Ste14